MTKNISFLYICNQYKSLEIARLNVKVKDVDEWVLELEIDCDLRVDERGEEWMSEFMSNQQ